MPKETKPANPYRGMGMVLEDPGSFTMTLLGVVLDVFGTESLSWDPATIHMELEQEFGVMPHPSCFDRLCLGVSLLTSNSFYVSTTDFVHACVVLSGHFATPDLLTLPDCSDLAWGITEGMLISPPDEGVEEPFAKEIVAFVGEALDQEGILVPPDVLRIGLRDKDVTDHVRYNFSDDPELFGAIQGVEKDKTDTINGLVRGRMRALIKQLRALPLQTGSVEKLAEKALLALPGDEDLPLFRV